MIKEYERAVEYRASVFRDGKCVKRRAECLISFSENPAFYPKIAIILKNRSELFDLQSSFYINVRARSFDMRGNLISMVETVKGHFLNPNQKFYDYLRHKNVLEIGYSNLIYNSYLSRPLDDLKKNVIKFYLVNINFSFTYGMPRQDDDGIHHNLKSYFGDFKIIDDAVISFSSETRYSEIDEDTLRRYFREVLVIKYDGTKSTQRRLETFVKSLLPYLSFLSRSNVRYNHVMQMAKGSNVISQKFLVMSLNPKISGYNYERDYVIYMKHHKDFIQNAISTLVSGNKPDLDSVYQFNDAFSRIIDKTSYVILFMALEALIDGYINSVRRSYVNYLVRTFPKKKGFSKRIYFKKVIKRNSIKLVNKYNFIISVSNINNSDLWPLCDQVAYLNLSRIRNKLVHEGKIRDRKNLWTAFCHLDWIYLRFFLFIARWTGSNNLGASALREFIPYNDWRNNLIYK